MKIVLLLLINLLVNVAFAAAPVATHSKKRVTATHNKAASHKPAGKKVAAKGKKKQTAKHGKAHPLRGQASHSKSKKRSNKGSGNHSQGQHAANGGSHGMPSIKNIQQIDQCLAGDVRNQFREQIEEFAKFKDLPQMFQLIQKKFIPILLKLEGFSQKLNNQGLVAKNSKDIAVIQKKCQAISAKRKVPVNVCVQKLMKDKGGQSSASTGKSFNANTMKEALLKPLMQLNAVQKNKKPISFLEFETALNNFLEEIDYYIVKGIVYQQAFRKVKNPSVQKIISLGDDVFAQLGKMVNSLHEVTNILQNDVVYTQSIACHPAQYFASLGGVSHAVGGGNQNNNQSFDMQMNNMNGDDHEMFDADENDQHSIWNNHNNMNNNMSNQNGGGQMFGQQNQWQNNSQQLSGQQPYGQSSYGGGNQNYNWDMPGAPNSQQFNGQPPYGQFPNNNGKQNYSSWNSSGTASNQQPYGQNANNTNQGYNNWGSSGVFNSAPNNTYQGGGYGNYAPQYSAQSAPYQNNSMGGSWNNQNAAQSNNYSAYNPMSQSMPSSNPMQNNYPSSFSGNFGSGFSQAMNSIFSPTMGGGFSQSMTPQPISSYSYAQPQFMMPQMPAVMPSYMVASPSYSNIIGTGIVQPAGTVTAQADDGYETVMMPVQVNADGQPLTQNVDQATVDSFGQNNQNSNALPVDNSGQQQNLNQALQSVERELQDTEDKIEASANKLENAVVRAEKAANRAEKAADKVVVGTAEKVDTKKKNLVHSPTYQNMHQKQKQHQNHKNHRVIRQG